MRGSCCFIFRVRNVAPIERSDFMLLFITCLTIGFIIGRKIQDYRIQKLTEKMFQLEHQKKMLETGNPFWYILPESNRKTEEDENNKTES